MEYADVLHRPGMVPLTADAVDAVLNMVCKVAEEQKMHFLWRPQLRDPNDEMVLEAAVNGRADFIVTHNLKDFAAATRFAVRALTPAQFIQHLNGVPP